MNPTQISPTGAAVPTVAGFTGDGVKPSMTHGASPQKTPFDSAMMVSGQQSEGPLVPAMDPHPTPPHWPHSSLQHTASALTPGMPFEHVDGAVYFYIVLQTRIDPTNSWKNRQRYTAAVQQQRRNMVRQQALFGRTIIRPVRVDTDQDTGCDDLL